MGQVYRQLKEQGSHVKEMREVPVEQMVLASVAADLLQSAFTGFCLPAKIILKAFAA